MIHLRRFDDWLEGQNDDHVTMLIVGTAVVAVAVALWAPRPVKVAVLGWLWLP